MLSLCPDLGTAYGPARHKQGASGATPHREKGKQSAKHPGGQASHRPSRKAVVEILVIDKVSTPFESQAVIKLHSTHEPSVFLTTTVAPFDGRLCLRSVRSSERMRRPRRSRSDYMCRQHRPHHFVFISLAELERRRLVHPCSSLPASSQRASQSPVRFYPQNSHRPHQLSPSFQYGVR